MFIQVFDINNNRNNLIPTLSFAINSSRSYQDSISKPKTFKFKEFIEIHIINPLTNPLTNPLSLFFHVKLLFSFSKNFRKLRMYKRVQIFCKNAVFKNYFLHSMYVWIFRTGRSSENICGSRKIYVKCIKCGLNVS